MSLRSFAAPNSDVARSRTVVLALAGVEGAAVASLGTVSVVGFDYGTISASFDSVAPLLAGSLVACIAVFGTVLGLLVMDLRVRERRAVVEFPALGGRTTQTGTGAPRPKYD